MSRKQLLLAAAVVAVAGTVSCAASTSSAAEPRQPVPEARAPGFASAPASDVPALFTDQQAERGEQVYERVCLDCHTKVEFKERQFLFAWEGASVAQVYAYIAENMPDDGPGSLKEAEYVEAMAYILAMNGYPSGAEELTADMERMRGVLFESHLADGGDR